MPLEESATSRLASAVRSSTSSSWAARERPSATGRPRSRPAYSSISSPLSRSNSLASAVTTPMTALAATGSAHTSRPLITTRPASGRSSPVIMDNDVVFPAPFGPTSPASEPAAMSRSIAVTASLSPKLLRSPRTSIARSAISASSAAIQLVRNDAGKHRLRPDGLGELARRSELVGDDQLLVVVGYLNAGPDEDMVTVDGDGRIGAGGQRRLQQDRAGGGVERVQVAAIGRGEYDFVADRGGAVRRRRAPVIPHDLSVALVHPDHLPRP